MTENNTDQENTNDHQDNNRFSKKVWIVGGILSLIVILILLFKALFSVLLLSLTAILIAVYFRGCANILHRNLHWPLKLCTFLSVFINILLIIGFFWFAGARLQQQISELSTTLPQTIQHAKDQLGQSTLGSKVLQMMNGSGDSLKTTDLLKKFFSSSFGVLSDLYIILLLALFFTANPMLYKKGIVHLLPSAAKDKG